MGDQTVDQMELLRLQAKLTPDPVRPLSPPPFPSLSLQSSLSLVHTLLLTEEFVENWIKLLYKLAYVLIFSLCREAD